MVKINSLYSLENVADCYEFDKDTLQVVNVDTGVIKKQMIDKRGYMYVTLSLKAPTPSGRKQANVKMHKIIALAIIRNGPYILIEHLDDNPLNNDPANLKFSDKHNNAVSMFKNGIVNHHYIRRYCMKMLDGSEYVGTMRELSAMTGVPKATIYDRWYKSREIPPGHGKRPIDTVTWINQDEQTG